MSGQEEVQIFCWLSLASIVIPLIGLIIIKIIENKRGKK